VEGFPEFTRFFTNGLPLALRFEHSRMLYH